MASSLSLVRLLVLLIAWVAALGGVSLAQPASTGVSAATTSTLEVLWQVQATSVGLVLVLVVFVFGLLPQGRRRLTYRQFLRRTWALGLTIFNVGSLLFNGLVLLGAGHQVPPTPAVAGHGWAVTVASVTAMVSIGSIVVLLARTIRAIDPATSEAVQGDYRRSVVARAVRGELQERASLGIIFSWGESEVCEFSPAYSGPGVGITAGKRRDCLVRDVSIWRLRLLTWHASRKRRKRPVLRVWPGRLAGATTPLIIIDPYSRTLTRWWARRCVRVLAIPPDELADALNALHAETLDDIRADRPIEAVLGMQTLAGLHQPIWQAYAAHGLTYDNDARQVFHLYRRTISEQIIGLLDDELRVAAICRDDRIRREATLLPRQLAREALTASAAGTIQQSLEMLLGVYAAVVNDLTNGGQQILPSARFARTRIHAPFQSLLSFTNGDLQRAIDQAGNVDSTTAPTTEALSIVKSAEFAVTQLRVAHQQMLEMLRYAVRLRDSTTVRAVLAAWDMPDMFLARDALQESSENAGLAPTRGGERQAEVFAPLQQLSQSLDAARDDLDAMLLRLLIEALKTERPTAPEAASAGPGPAEDGNPLQESPDRKDDREPVVAAVLDRLPAGRLWHALETTLSTAAGEFPWPTDDGRILPVGVMVVGGPIDTTSLVLEAFTLAAIVRQDLTAGSGPSPDLALTDTPRLCTAIDQVLGSRLLWLQHYGISEEVARRRGANLKDRLTAAARSARHDQEEKIRTSPILPAAVDKLRTEARAAFHAADITSKLLSWAGNPPSTTSRRQVSGVCLFASASAPRSIFIGEDDSDLAAIGGWLGGTIAQALLGYLLIRALECTEARSISPADSAVKVRDAIAEIRDRPPTGKAHPSAKIVIIIPDVPYDLRKDIGVTGTDADAWRSEDQRREREQIAEELGLTGSSLALQLAGSIDGVPVIKTRVSVKRIVILDMARLGKLYLAADDKAAPAEPGLVLIGPVQAGTAATVTRGSGTSQNSPSAAGVNTDPGDSVPAEQNHDDTLQVKMRSWLPLEFSTSDPAASRTLTWDEWQ